MGRLFETFLGEALDLLLPPVCPGCGQRGPGWPAVFCGPCADTLVRAPGPVLPGRADRFDMLLSPFLYGGALARAIVRFKHGDMPALGARLAAAALESVPCPPVDLVAPVPLHAARIARRGFNQAAIIARRAARASGGKLAASLLVRNRDTPSQAGRSTAERRANVRGAFACRPGGPPVDGRQVLLVDDVWTTGATARECSRVLARAGARSIIVYTLARVE